jgi:tripartite-type tricarboxylate transporter receptor subunit TctC
MMRRFRYGCCVAFIAGTVASAHAQQQSGQAGPNYSNKPVRIIVGSSPGGGSDIIARLVSQKLAELWDNPVIVENRSAGAVYGLEAAGRATPDGYTIGFAPNSGYSAAVLAIELPFDLKKSIEPIVQLTSQPYLLLANPSLPVKSVKELIGYAKAKPGVLNYASTGHGAQSHLGMELFNLMAGLKTVHIAFKGSGPAYIALMAGEVQLFIGSMVSSVQHVKAKKMVALAVTADKRSRIFPDLPTVAESGLPGYELSGWYGLIGPSGMPRSVVEKIHQSANRVLASPDVEKKITSDGSDVVLSKSPAEFKRVVMNEIGKWEKFQKATGIKLDK